MPLTDCVERRAGGLLLAVAAQDDAPFLERLLMLSPVELRSRPDVTVIRDLERAWVFRIERPGRPALFWKEFGPRDLWDVSKEFWRPSKALRAWQGAEGLMRLDIGAARLVARGEELRRVPFRHRRSFMVTEEITDAESFSSFLWQAPVGDSGASARRKHDLMRQIGRTVARMHKGGLYHGDLRPGNTFCRFSNGGAKIFLIDTDRILGRRLPGLRQSVHNLMQLSFFFAPAYSLADRVRLLDAYARERGFDRATRRRLIAWTADWVYRRLRRRLARKGKARPRQGIHAHMIRLFDRLEARRRH